MNKRLQKTTNDRVYSLRLDLAREKKYREETEEKNAQEIGDIQQYNQKKKLKKKEDGQDQNQQTIKRLGDSILKLQEILTIEKKQREIVKAQMFRMLDELNIYLKSELNAERNERETTEETIINMQQSGEFIKKMNHIIKQKENIYFFFNKYKNRVVQMEEENNFKDSFNDELTNTRSPKSKKIKKIDSPSHKKHVGHWTKEEHEKYLQFLEDNTQMKKNNKIFKPMSEMIGTRSPSQCRSHHQKFNPQSPLIQSKCSKIMSNSNQTTAAMTLQEETNVTLEDEMQNNNRIKLMFFEEDDIVQPNFNLDDL